MTIRLLGVCGFAASLQAMRLPHQAVYNNDGIDNDKRILFDIQRVVADESCMFTLEIIKDRDIELASKLVKAGDEHAKAMRGISAYISICAPRYFWQEMATYNIGCECLSSTSTMHTLTKGVTADMFECENKEMAIELANSVKSKIDEYNRATTKDEKAASFRTLKQTLPEAFINTRAYAISYQTLRRIYFQRRNHRLNEWHIFCQAIEHLPYAEQLITIE